MRYTLRQLAIFVAVARNGSISRAAETLSMSQSAASSGLAELERQFDVQLFDRVGKSVRLNELGERLLLRAVEFLGRAEDIEALLRGQTGYGTLDIGATLTIGNYLATLIVAEFLQRHSDSRIRLGVHNTATIIQQVASFELDLGLIEGKCQHAELEVVPWLEDELVVFCAPTHPLTGCTQADEKTLLEQPWILREIGSGTRETFDQAMRHVEGRLDVRLELEHTEAIKRAVESGLGVGCISRLALREAFRRGSLVPVETPWLDLRRRFHFLWHRRKFRTPGMRAFLELCLEMTAGARRSDEIALSYIR
ncbi:LysR substrate-binding domain-containing protein [Aromatoleum aromaticum]|uniref:Transcriptional regulator, LysR family n=1 Tax=Aromatoleum aromaticum (strain DSM 19018 / LMG 30748 / EbN1) TaxID=76114 RepID=Q5NZ97_AROAE|nr:LysR substrate-binding domain-containing protein [Aromatoleum aromaticum]NMG54078.1 LysR family transcriptional regulator [Aromatoleum aromaticum]CAI09617.1 transcriptional regulator, LysR family [Aromatoleum aromaticum EbN1]